MRFTVLGHAALFVEAAGRTILVDPWLGGSCYWRSWWHYPPPVVRDEHLSPDFVAITHHHFDHFHYPSMRRLDRRATVLVPRFGVDVMPRELQGLGFGSVVELVHGRPVELAPGLRVASYQYGFDDSAFVVEADGCVLADLNDCKMRGPALDELLAAFGRPTFLLKSHSWAQAYPVRYRAADPRDLGLVRRESYWEDFCAVVRQARPRWAVPFASMTCFLHPETAEVNGQHVTPPEVAAAFAASGGAPGTEVVVMAPGDGWSTTDGFALGGGDPYGAGRDAALARLAAEAAPALERAASEEAGVCVAWEAFADYFGRFVGAVPRPAARALVPRPVVFEVPSGAPAPFWVVDAVGRRVARLPAPPADAASVIRVPEAVLADAIAKGIVHLVHISLRLEVELAPGGAATDLTFWGLLATWELGYLPLRRLDWRRLAGVAWRRRRELGGMVATRLVGRGSFAERMVTTMTAPPEPTG